VGEPDSSALASSRGAGGGSGGVAGNAFVPPGFFWIEASVVFDLLPSGGGPGGLEDSPLRHGSPRPAGAGPPNSSPRAASWGPHIRPDAGKLSRICPLLASTMRRW